jgi:diguanylate cyclase (GGDEF)-like protein
MVGVLYLTLDHFKAVNAKLGLRGGDAVFVQVAERLKQFARRGDMVARMGSDEFAMIGESLGERDGAAVVARRLLKEISRPFNLDGREFTITTSIGIAVYPSDSEDLDELLQKAEAAMCDAKAHGGNCHRFHTAEMDMRNKRVSSNRIGIAAKVALLTPREREVLELLVTGKTNKMIANLLGTSSRTIENHRAKIMDKMQAGSLPDLVRMMLELHA